MTVFRIAVLALFSCLLSACGGGGGSGSGGGNNPPPGGIAEFQVTLDRTALTFQASEGGAAPSQTIVATWTGTPPDPVYITATVEGAGIAPTIPTLINQSSATATVSVANGLPAGNYTGRINFLVCRDAACTQRVGGSPLPVSFTVNVSAAAVSTAPIAFEYVAGNTMPAPRTVQVASHAGAWTVSASAPWVSVSPISGQGAGAFNVSFDPAFAAAGTQSATITVSSATGAQTIPVSLAYSTPASGGGGAATGEFTLSASAVGFFARRSGPAPASYGLRLNVIDARPVTVGAAFVTSAPDWVNVSISGQSPFYVLTLNVSETTLPLGVHTATLAVGTIDSSGNVLHREDVAISLHIFDVVRAFGTPIRPSFVLGSSVSSASSIISIEADPVTAWTVASSASWVSTSVASGSGDASVNVQVDAANLDVGTHTGTITIANPHDTTNTITVPVTATVVEPTISVTSEPVVIGGADGLSSDRGGTFALSINTGTRSYPWSATATTASGEDWLTLPAASGQVGSTSTHIAIEGDRTLVDPGSHEGTVSIQINVRGRTYSRSVPIVLNQEGHWLQASVHGAAFSSFPGRSVLSRSVQIASTLGHTDVPWSATSDASWLSVTASGTTGDTLVLTANPTGLQEDTTHIATVTIVSSDPEILNQESIRVAFWAGATDPQPVILNGWQPHIAANPVEPWVYTSGGGSASDNIIRIYNVYTGALVDSWMPQLTYITDLAISQDGTLLFVNDWGSHAIVALDARTGATVRSYPYDQSATPIGMAHIDAGGRPTLIIGEGDIYDVTSGTRHSGRINAGWHQGRLSFSVDPLNQYLYTQNIGVSGSTATQFSIKRTALIEDGVAIAPIEEASGGSNGQDICVSGDGARVYTANGAPYLFYVFTANGFQYSAQLAGEGYPNNAECGWNGIFIGGTDAYYETEDTWVYRPDGSLITTFKLADTTYTRTTTSSLVLSGDNTRVIGSASGTAIGTALVFKSIPAP